MDISGTFHQTDIINVSDAVLQEINRERETTYVLISYRECPSCWRDTTVNLVVNKDTAILNENRESISVRDLQPGMIISASFSDAMTRSIPPQSQAFRIRVISRLENESTSVGRVIEVNRQGNYILTMQNRNPSSIIRFNITPDTVILDPSGRKVCCARLLLGLRVRIQHAAFMTASIPPQTTAFVIQILRN